MDYNSENFKALLKEAIGTKSKTEFSRLSGISRQHIGRMINRQDIGVPSKETLQKIAKASSNRVKLKDLYLSCGYDSFEEDHLGQIPALYSHEERAVNYAIKTRENVLDSIESIRGWKNLNLFIHYITSRFSSLQGRLEVLKRDQEYLDPSCVGAENYSLMSVTYELDDIDVVVYFVVTYSFTKKNKVVLLNSCFGAEKLYELSAMPKEIYERIKQADDGSLKSPFVYKIHCKANLVENYKKHAKFADNTLNYIKVLSGLGFYTKDIDKERVKDFVIEHKGAFMGFDYRKFYYKISDNQEISLNDISSFKNKEDGSVGMFAAIAYIMSKETGYSFKYYSDPNGVEMAGNNPCIMYLTEEKGIKTALLEGIINKYANELLVDRHGTCFYQVYDEITVKNKKTTNTKED